MEHYKVLIINDEGENIDIEKRVIEDTFSGKDADVEIKYIPPSHSEEISKQLIDADGVITVYMDFNRETLQRMKKCKIISTQTIGFDAIDIKAATELGICVTNVPDYCVEEVAVHTVTLALCAARKVTTFDRIARQKIWNVDDIYKYGQIHRLTEKTYGIVSFGNIGRRVASIMKKLGMKIIAYDPFVNDYVFEEQGVHRASSLKELFASSNIVSLHTPFSSETQGMVGYDLIASMPKDGILINTSRGGIIKENELAKALEEGILGAAAVDVIVDETNFDSPLYGINNCIITPHVAYYSEEALKECREKAATMVGDVLAKSIVPRYLVNKDVVVNARKKLDKEEEV